MGAIVYSIYFNSTDKCYIGMTVNYQDRKKQHLYELKTGRHSCRELQGAYDKFGIDDMAFSIEERCSNSERHAREKAVASKYGPGKLFNPGVLNGYRKQQITEECTMFTFNYRGKTFKCQFRNDLTVQLTCLSNGITKTLTRAEYSAFSAGDSEALCDQLLAAETQGVKK